MSVDQWEIQMVAGRESLLAGKTDFHWVDSKVVQLVAQRDQKWADYWVEQWAASKELHWVD